MRKLKLLVMAVLVLIIPSLLCGCITTALIMKSARERQELYCIVSMPVSYSTPLNGSLYDLSHECGVGVYIVDESVPKTVDSDGETIDMRDGFAESMYDLYTFEPYDDYVLLAIEDNVFESGNAGEAFADITAGGAVAETLTDGVRETLASGVKEALEECRDNKDSAEPGVTNDEYRDVLYDYLESLKPYLEQARG